MKKLIIASFFCLTAIVANAQNEDAQIQQIEIEIKAAAASGDYDKAASLQEQKATLLKIKQAVANGDYELANQLKNGTTGSSSNKGSGSSEIQKLEAQQKQAAASGDYEKAAQIGKQIDALKNGTSVSDPAPTTNSNDSRSRRPENERSEETTSPSNGRTIMKRGFFIDIIPGFGYFTSETTQLPEFGFAMGGRIGSKFYFGKSNFYRPGIQFIWGRLGFIASGDADSFGIFFAPVNVGFTNLIAFNDKMGVEINYNMGIAVHGDGGSTASVPFGWVYNPTVKFRLGKLALGIDILYSNPFGLGAVEEYGDVLYYDSGYYQYGVTAGLKF